MNILSASYSNAEHTAAVIHTEEAGAVFISLAEPEDASGGWREAFEGWQASGGVVVDYVAPVDVSRGAQRSAIYGEFLQLPAAIRGQFAPFYAAVNLMLDNGDDEGAAACVAAVAVPPELEAMKAAILARIQALPEK